MKTTYKVLTTFGGRSLSRTEKAARAKFVSAVRHFIRERATVTVTLTEIGADDSVRVLDSVTLTEGR